MSSATVIRWSGKASILSGLLILLLFLSWPTGSFWPIALANFPLTLALLLLPFGVSGIYFWFKGSAPRLVRAGTILAVGGISSILLAYVALSVFGIYSPTGALWQLFLAGFFALGCGLLCFSLIGQRGNTPLRWNLFVAGWLSIFVFLAADMLGQYPFPPLLWVSFGASWALLGATLWFQLGNGQDLVSSAL